MTKKHQILHNTNHKVCISHIETKSFKKT